MVYTARRHLKSHVWPCVCKFKPCNGLMFGQIRFYHLNSYYHPSDYGVHGTQTSNTPVQSICNYNWSHRTRNTRWARPCQNLQESHWTRSAQVYLCLESRKLEHTQPADLAESCLPKSAREVSSQRRRWCPSRSSYQQQPLHPSILLLHDADVVLRRRDAPRAFLLPHSLASRAWHTQSNDTPTTEVECTSLLLPLPPDQITLHDPVSPFLISILETKIVQHGGNSNSTMDE